MGWLPCGPGDRFFPWYGRGINRVNVVNFNNIHNTYGGMNPLREGPRSISNIDRAGVDERVRGGISSMHSNDFGNSRVPREQSRIDPGGLRQASIMTGANPVSPSHNSFNSVDRQVNPRSIPSRSVSNQHFFSSPARTNSPMQAGRGGNVPSAPGYGQQTSRQNQSIQSSRPGWHTFTPPPGQNTQSNSGRSFERQSTPQGRPGYSQSPSGSAAPQYQNNSRGGPNYGSSNNGYNRPTLNMQQPVVRPRSGGYYGGQPAPSTPRNPGYGGYSAPRSGGSYPARPTPSAPPSGGGYRSAPPSGGYHGAPSGGGSRGGNSRGGTSNNEHSSSGHDNHH